MVGILRDLLRILKIIKMLFYLFKQVLKLDLIVFRYTMHA